MPRATGTIILVAGVALFTGAGWELAAQTPKSPGESTTASTNPACALLSVAEIRQITGTQQYDHPWEAANLGEGTGGGSACVFEGPEAGSRLENPPPVGFSLISGRRWTQKRRTVKLLEGCRREPVKGVGDDAFFESCPAKGAKRRTDPLYVQVGRHDLIVQMDVKRPATEASGRPAVVAVAKAVAAKLRARP